MQPLEALYLALKHANLHPFSLIKASDGDVPCRRPCQCHYSLADGQATLSLLRYIRKHEQFWKNLQNAAYPEIVFCYIPRKLVYFILPHIVFVFYFPSRVQQPELCRSVLTKIPIFFAFIFCSVTYFVSCFVLMHKLRIVS